MRCHEPALAESDARVAHVAAVPCAVAHALLPLFSPWPAMMRHMNDCAGIFSPRTQVRERMAGTLVPFQSISKPDTVYVK